LTPPASEGALDGITSAVIRDLALAAGLAWEECRLARYHLFVADECFLSGTGAEVIPMIYLDGRRIGSGLPGQITQSLNAAFREFAAHEGDPVF
jgi:branched-chain amino acid aminotransferase